VTSVSLPDLERLEKLVATGQLPMPLSAAALQAVGLGHAWTELAPFAALDGGELVALLRTVRAERTGRPVPRLELVWTGPEARVSAARDTAVVVRELFAGAQRRVVIGGFVFWGADEMFAPLHRAMCDRGVEVDIFLHLSDENGIETFFAHSWPFGPPEPRIYYDPRTLAGAGVSLHAKCIVVDERWALVTSANFTERAHTSNIEAGVLIDDPGFATALAGQWRGLVDEGLVVRYGESHGAG
jgi:hypothetical protein